MELTSILLAEHAPLLAALGWQLEKQHHGHSGQHGHKKRPESTTKKIPSTFIVNDLKRQSNLPKATQKRVEVVEKPPLQCGGESITQQQRLPQEKKERKVKKKRFKRSSCQTSFPVGNNTPEAMEPQGLGDCPDESTVCEEQGKAKGDRRFLNALLKNSESEAERLISTGQADLTLTVENSRRGFPFHGWNVLHVAAWGCQRLVSLITPHCDVHARTPHQQTALHIAALRGNSEAVSHLVRAGADVNSTNTRRFNQTPLQIAAFKGHADIVRILLQHGADPMLACDNPSGPCTPLDFAVSRGHDSVFALLFPLLASQLNSGTMAAAFTRAVAKGDTDFVTAMLPTSSESACSSALLTACRRGDSKMVQLLIQSGKCDLHVVEGTSALHVACQHNFPEILGVLLASCRDLRLELRDGAEETALGVACALGHTECVDLLLRAGVSVSKCTAAVKTPASRTQNSPLHHAALGGHAAVVVALLAGDMAAADMIQLENRAGMPALHLAARNGHSDVVRLLASVPLAAQTKSKRKSTSAGPTVAADVLSSEGLTALYIAAAAGQTDVIRTLLECGATVSAGVKRFSVLKAACQSGSELAVEMVLQAANKLTSQQTAVLELQYAESLPAVQDVLRRFGFGSTSRQRATTVVAGSLMSFLDGPATRESQQDTQCEDCARLTRNQDVDAHKQRSASGVATAHSSGGSVPRTAHTWRTIRLFISSTFVDMQAERDYIVKTLVPLLNEKCLPLKVHIIAVDLRWGITEEESNEIGTVIQLCLSEVNRCDLFLGLLGDRYGWVPDPTKVPDDVRHRFDWKDGMSVTSMEVEVGVIGRRGDGCGTNALFCFRDSSFVDSVPPAHKGLFVAGSPEDSDKMQALKQRVRSAKNATVFDYSSKCSEVTLTGEMVTNVGEVLGEKLLDNLYSRVITAIESQQDVSDDKPDDDPEKEQHDELMESRNRNFVGRKTQLKALRDYVDASSGSGQPLVVVAAPGSGKSGLLSRFVQTYRHEASHNTLVLCHFVGATPKSCNLRSTLWRLYSAAARELACRYSSVCEEGEEPTGEDADCQALSEALFRALRQLSSAGVKVVIIVDALNQFDSSDRAHSMNWLPNALPSSVRVIFSCVEQSDCLVALRARNTPELPLGPLTLTEREEMVACLLGEHHKRLDSAQMEALLQKPDSVSPLYLVVACEELRVFGSFEKYVFL